MQILFSRYVTMQRPIDHALGGMCKLAHLSKAMLTHCCITMTDLY